MKDKRVWVVFLIIVVNLLGFGIILPLLPYYAESLGANAVTLGFISATYSLCQFIAAPILGELSDKYGRRPILLFSVAGTAASFFILGFAKSIPILFLSRIVDGISGGNISTAQAYIADITPKEKRAQNMGLIGAAFGLGFIFGPALGGLLSQFGYGVPAVVAGVVTSIATLLAYFYLPETVEKSREKFVFKIEKIIDTKALVDAVKHPHVGDLIIITFLTNLAFAIMQAMFALFVEKRFGLGASNVGYIFGFIGILSVIVQMGLIKVVLKNVSEKKAMVFSTIASAIALAAIGISPNVWFLMLSLVVMSIGQGLVGPVVTAQISERTPAEEQGSIMGISQSIASVARLIGPLLGGYLFIPGAYALPYFASALIVSSSLFFISKKK